MAKAIRLDGWVYKNLLKYGNCALPNKCNEMDLSELQMHLSNEIQCEVKIRQAILIDSEKMKKIEKPYLIAEVERK